MTGGALRSGASVMMQSSTSGPCYRLLAMLGPRPMQLEAQHLAGVSERFVAGRQIAARVSFPSLVHIRSDRLEVGFGNVANLRFRAGDRERGRLVVKQRALGLRRGHAARGLGVELLVERDVGVIDLLRAGA